MDKIELHPAALDQLTNHQRQLDADGTFESLDELLAAYNALAATTSEPVAVKALEWLEPSKKTNGCWTADSPFGTYSVVNEGGWWAILEDAPWGKGFEWLGSDMSKDTLHTAQSAAEADYERRIRSALTTPPAAALDVAIEALGVRSISVMTANIRQGQSSTPRCESPGEADIEIAQGWVVYVLDAIKTLATLKATRETA